MAAVTPTLPELISDAATAFDLPTGGTTYVVDAVDSFQDALDVVVPGDVILLEAGATFSGNFVIREAGAGTDWIYIMSSDYANLPVEGNRVSPSDASKMAKISAPNSGRAIAAEFGTHHYRFVGLEITTTWNVRTSSQSLLVSLGRDPLSATSLSELPFYITFDRVYIHGNISGDTAVGIELNARYCAVLDSYIANIHSAGRDSQAIGSVNGAGPFKIVNNYLEAAGENIMFGGADPSITNLVPSDIEIRGNHFSKPLTWKADDPSYGSEDWDIKNLFEVKNAQRLLIEGNIFENSWADAQSGKAIIFKPVNQEGGAAWCTCADATFRYNIVRNVGSGLQVVGEQDGPTAGLHRIHVHDNLVDNVNRAVYGGDGRLLELNTVPNYGQDVIIDHNTMFHKPTATYTLNETLATIGDTADGMDDVEIYNNIGTKGMYGVKGSGQEPGTATLEYFFLVYEFVANLIVDIASLTGYPVGNFNESAVAGVKFVDYDNGNYRLAADSDYKDAGLDGKDLGADIDTLETLTANVISGQTSGGGGDPVAPSNAYVDDLVGNIVRDLVHSPVLG